MHRQHENNIPSLHYITLQDPINASSTYNNIASLHHVTLHQQPQQQLALSPPAITTMRLRMEEQQGEGEAASRFFFKTTIIVTFSACPVQSKNFVTDF